MKFRTQKLLRSSCSPRIGLHKSNIPVMVESLVPPKIPSIGSSLPLSESYGDRPTRHFVEGPPGVKPYRIVLMAGFETFNRYLYQRAAEAASKASPGLDIQIFTERDIKEHSSQLEEALNTADVFFASLIFDYEEVMWLKPRLNRIPVRFIFESALELMSYTQVGTFSMASSSDKKQGMPPAVKSLLSKFSSTREEDRLDGYTKFLRMGPNLLKYLPGDRARDLKLWLETYAFWNAGGRSNVANLFLKLGNELGGLPVAQMSDSSMQSSPEDDGPLAQLTRAFEMLMNWIQTLGQPPSTEIVKGVVELPSRGLIHPDRPDHVFSGPASYLEWYRRHRPESSTWPVVCILLYRKHVISELAYIPELIRFMEQQQLAPLPIFVTGVDAHIAVRDLLTSPHERAAVARGEAQANPTLSPEAGDVDAVVSTIGFPLVGGPAGSMEGARQADLAKQILTAKNVPYIVAAPLLIQDVKSWYTQGVAGLQSVVLYSLPELDGAVDAIPLGGLCCGDKAFCESKRHLAGCNREGGEIRLVKERLERLATRLRKWTSLRKKPISERKVAVVLYGYPPGLGAAGTAALLNVPRSLLALLKRLESEGYDVGELPEDPEELVRAAKQADQQAEAGSGFRSKEYQDAGGASVTRERLEAWLGSQDAERVSRQWGGRLDKAGIRTVGSGDAAEFLLGGRRFGKVWVAVQPPLGVPGDPMRLLFERDMTPHPQYTAFYKYIEAEDGFAADAIVHFGMHGTEEWLPGTPLGNTGECWPDVLTGAMPNVYVYAANNPSESLLAKRRGYGTIVSHNVPPYSRAGLYKELLSMRSLLADYFETAGRRDKMGQQEATYQAAGDASGEASGEAAPTTEGALLQTLFAAGLDRDCPLPDEGAAALMAAGGAEAGEKAAEAAAGAMRSAGVFEGYCERLRGYLGELEQRLFSAGLHTLGEAPSGEELEAYLRAYFEDGSWDRAKGTADTPGERESEGGAKDTDDKMPFSPKILELVVQGREVSEVEAQVAAAGLSGLEQERAERAAREACLIRDLLARNTEEVDSVVRALNGEFVAPAPGGDLLRDGAGVLPTGRNIHALDPYRMPSKVAMARGRASAELSIQMHQKDNGGAFPETVAVNLWGLEAIKTRGESVAVVLALVGAEPVVEATGRVVRYELIPLEKLGRPRIDVLSSLSGIFRDSFSNVVDLLDDVMVRAAQADEPADRNFVRKHALEMQQAGLGDDAATARIFSNPAGEFGSMVNERVSDSSWEKSEDLGETWAARNAFAFGRGRRGVQNRAALDVLMKTTGQVVQCIDSVEYGLTDIQEYYANTGAMAQAMDTAQGGQGKVQVAVVESYSQAPRPKRLNEVLRLEYRSKLLNPKWANSMVEQGSGGAFEVSQRMTALVGWAATTKFQEDWVFTQSAETYALDPTMAQKLKDANPEAFKNVVGRLIEASNRGMWNAAPEVLEKLQDLYSDLDDTIEMGTSARPQLQFDRMDDRRIY